MGRSFPFYLVVLLMFQPMILKAQLTAPDAHTVRYTSYVNSPEKDPIFVYCDTGSEKGSLLAQDSTGAVQSDYNWYMWNTETDSFDLFLKSDVDVATSLLSEVEEGGYRVIISNSPDTMRFTCWVYIDKPNVSADLMNNGCDYVALDGEASVDAFNYYDLISGDAVGLPNAVGHLWTSSPQSSIPYPDLRIDPYTYDPPLEDVTYKLVVTDSMGCSSEDSFFYESIHVNSDFSVDVDQGEAPLEVNFINESVRGYYYSWNFGDETEISLLENPGTHTFYRPGTYYVRLDIESELHCTHSDSLKIVVESSLLRIPNAFTPNEDGYNDRFLVEKRSLRYLRIQIFSNTGGKVYGFTGNSESIMSWEGWDGNINNSNRKAGPGVYFYIINATGWDDKEYEGREYRGFLYLYR